MFNYILKRILIFIPTLLLVTAIVFTLSRLTSGDPVALQLETAADNSFSDELYRQKAIELGYDKPVFYFTITSAAYPYSLNNIIKKDESDVVEKLIAESGNADAVLNYFNNLKTLINKIDKNTNREDTANVNLVGSLNELKQLLYQTDASQIVFNLNNIKNNTTQNIDYQKDIQNLERDFYTIKNQATHYKTFIPSIRWYGIDNQYHHWLTNILKGNLGNSFKTGYPVWQKLKTPLSITLVLTLLALLFSYTLAIPIGLYIAAKKDAWQGKWLMRCMFFLFSMPNFWVATLAIVFLTTPQYGMKIFPSAGLAHLSSDASIGEWFLSNIGRLILPVLCMIIHPVAELSRQLQSNTLDILKLDYIRTARAKGLKWRTIYEKHALKNAIFPLITMLGQLFAAGISGSVIVEFIFNIHGIGLTLLEAIGARDWNVVYGVLLIVATAVLIGHLITDILYYIFNPKMINA
jgi:peptide/nickel transport system permease protein